MSGLGLDATKTHKVNSTYFKAGKLDEDGSRIRTRDKLGGTGKKGTFE